LVGIKIRDNESIDRALRRFKRTINRSKVLRIYRETLAYTKPSETNRLAKQKNARVARRATREETEM
jgi:small subunit ribosomal protein S21